MKGSYVTRFFSLQNIEENDALEDGHVCLSVRSLVWVCVRLCVNARTYSDKIWKYIMLLKNNNNLQFSIS